MPHTDYVDRVPVKRSCKFRAYPTRPQEGRAVWLLADHCDLYNAALMERREAWQARRVTVSYGTQSAQLTEIRRADPDGQGRHSFTAQQQTLRRLNTVFAAFFDRVRAAGKAARKQPGYPRIKPYQRFSQVLFVAGDGAKWRPSGFGRWAYATFQAVGTVKVREHRPAPARSRRCSSRGSTVAGPSSWSPRPSLCRCRRPGARSATAAGANARARSRRSSSAPSTA